MKLRIYNALIHTSFPNIVLNCVARLNMVARIVDTKMVNLGNGEYLMMSSYNLSDRDGNKFNIRCYYSDCEQIITDIDVEVIEEKYEIPEKVAKEVAFCPLVRVVVPNGGCNGYTENEYAEILAKEKLESWTKAEIIDWVMENLEDVMESYEPYDKEYDD
jgi:hypothetical protein